MANRQLSVSHSEQNEYQFKLDVHIKKRRLKPLFEAFGKSIYDAEWINRDNSPIVLLKIDGAKASREASFYVNLSCHPYIVHTFGFVQSNPGSVMLVQECAPLGDLSDRLQEGDFRPTERVLCEIFRQICDALICLADNGILHGDLACRNVLVFKSDPTDPEKNLVKLTDFGLTRASSLYSVVDSPARTTMTIIPLRYAAPELLRNTADRLNYSEKSDAYSMGVLMWEACSNGEMPYSLLETDNEVRRNKLTDQRLSRPSLCGDQLWDMINGCWHQNPEDRPDFRTLNQYISSLSLYLNNQNNAPKRIRCEYCQKSCTSNDYPLHQRNCIRDRSNNIPTARPALKKGFVRIPNVNGDETIDLSNRQANPTNSTKRRNEGVPLNDLNKKRINESIPCEFCDESYSRNRIYTHQINCSRNPDSLVSESTNENILLLPNDKRPVRRKCPFPFLFPCSCC